ncbi:MAG TPA: LacI family DNA-binding transcriptional regulator, partial [Anaerolineae bacterium]
MTLKDVAAKAGVSYQTVSKVLNNQGSVASETEARIWEVVEALNYRPNISARNLRTQSSNLIGYAWRQAVDSNPRPILDQFLYYAALKFEEYGYHLLTFLVGTDEELDVTPYQELYGRRQVEGFVLADTV